MSNVDIAIKKGDRLPSVYYQLVGPTGVMDLTGYTVAFAFELVGVTGSPLGGACTIEDAATGLVRYDWGVGDTATVGTYYAEFVATSPDSKEMSFPNNKYLKLVVYEDVS